MHAGAPASEQYKVDAPPPPPLRLGNFMNSPPAAAGASPLRAAVAGEQKERSEAKERKGAAGEEDKRE